MVWSSAEEKAAELQRIQAVRARDDEAAVSGGVSGLEAAAIVPDADAVEAAGLAAVHDLTPSAPVFLAGPDGTVRTTAQGRRAAHGCCPPGVRLTPPGSGPPHPSGSPPSSGSPPPPGPPLLRVLVL